MLFSYIPIVYQSFARREVRITMLDAWAGSPPSATEILSRASASGSLSRLDTFFADWEYWCSDLLESHLSYSAIGYFWSQHPRQSWVSALAAVLDVATLVKVGIEGVPSWRAHLTFAAARHAAVDFAHVLGTPPRQLSDRLPPHALALVRGELERASRGFSSFAAVWRKVSIASLLSEHPVWIRAGDVRRKPRSGIVWVADNLQGVPMFDGFSIGVHLIDVDTGDPWVLRVVVEEIQKVHVRPYIGSNGDDAMNHNTRVRPFLRDPTEELAKRVCTVWNERIVLDVRRAHERGGRFL